RAADERGDASRPRGANPDRRRVRASANLARSRGRKQSMAIAEISPLTDTSLDLLELRHRRRESALHQLAQCAFEHQAVRHPALLETLLLRRERLGSTALGRGHAVTGAWSWCVHAPLV